MADNEHLDLLEEAHKGMIERGMRDDPLAIKIGQAIDKARPQPKQPVVKPRLDSQANVTRDQASTAKNQNG